MQIAAVSQIFNRNLLNKMINNSKFKFSKFQSQCCLLFAFALTSRQINWTKFSLVAKPAPSWWFATTNLFPRLQSTRSTTKFSLKFLFIYLCDFLSDFNSCQLILLDLSNTFWFVLFFVKKRDKNKCVLNDF